MDNKAYIKDKFAKTAKQKGYRSRAALKLLEIHTKVNLIKPGMAVLDLGAAPGGWSQVVCNLLQNTGKVIGIDLLPIQPFKNAQFIQASFHNSVPEIDFDLILSDVCPNKTGNWFVDDCNMFDLCKDIVQVACKHLKSNGKFICKFFNGPREKEFNNILQEHFRNVKKFKPAASRSCSSEFYYYCEGCMTKIVTNL